MEQCADRRKSGGIGNGQQKSGKQRFARYARLRKSAEKTVQPIVARAEGLVKVSAVENSRENSMGATMQAAMAPPVFRTSIASAKKSPA